MKLGSVLDLAAAKRLWAELNNLRTHPVEIDASGVERLGGLCLQVLIAARLAWNADGVAFTIANPSPAFTGAVRLMAAHELLAAEG